MLSMKATEVRKDISVSELRRHAKTEKNARVSRRLLGMAHLIETGNRHEAQVIACLTINTFRTWIKRFNEEGIAGLFSRKAPGFIHKLTPEIKQKLKEKIVSGTSEEGLVRYRIVDLQSFLKNDHAIDMSLSGVWYTLRDLNLSWKTARQRHPLSKKETQDAFKKTSKTT